MKGGHADRVARRTLIHVVGGVAVLVVVAAAAHAQTPPSGIRYNGVTALDNTGDLRSGWDWKGNFGVQEQDTYAYTCPPAPAGCSSAPAERGVDFRSKHGVPVTGLRYKPDDPQNNTDVLNPARTGGWGIGFPGRDGSWAHVCVLDESDDCDGRPANLGGMRSVGNFHHYGSYTRPDSAPSVYPAAAQAGLGNLAGGQVDFLIYPIVDHDIPADPRLLEPTEFPTAVMHWENFRADEPSFASGNPYFYRRTFLPAIPTDGSVYDTPFWDAATTVSFGMRDPARPPPALRYSSTNGFALPDPTEPYDSRWSGSALDCPVKVGPGSISQGAVFTGTERCFEGMMLEFDLAGLPNLAGHPGLEDPRSGILPPDRYPWDDAVLIWYLAIAPTPADVQPLLDALEADIWFTAQGPDHDDGSPGLTLIWAFPHLYPLLPPTAVITPDIPVPDHEPDSWVEGNACIGQAVTFEADSAQAYPARLKSNQWTVDGASQGVNDPRADLAWTFTTAGAHALRLTETNDKGLVGTKDITVTVLDCTPPPLAPTARLDVPTVTLDDCAPATFKFTGMASAIKGRPDQDFVKWSLTFGDGASTGLLDWPPPAFVLHDYLQPGTFVATVLVKDSKGMTDTEIQYVQVCPNRLPTVTGPAKILAQSGTVVTLPVTLGDRDWGAQVTLRLTGLPGTPSIGPITMPYHGSFTITGLLPGIYPVVAEATDETGAATQWHFPIIVSKRPNPAPDFDHDGVSDSADLCGGQGGAMLDGCQTETGPVGVSITLAPPDQDQDGVPDAADNCATTPNPRQDDLDMDLLGDACDEDDDGDGISETGPLLDNCPGLANPDQLDQDHDGTGDACRAPVFPRSATATPATWPHARGRDTWTPTTATTFAVGIAAVLAGLAWLNRHRLVWLATFSRLAKDRLLESPVRARLADLVSATPGLHRAELARRAGIGPTKAEHHLAVLAGARLVRVESVGKHRRYYPVAGTVAASPLGALNPKAQEILAAVAREPGLSLSDVSRATGLKPATAQHHVRRLEAARMLVVEHDATRLRLWTPREPAAVP